VDIGKNITLKDGKKPFNLTEVFFTCNIIPLKISAFSKQYLAAVHGPDNNTKDHLLKKMPFLARTRITHSGQDR